ncbi:MAG: glycosyltransferase family 39 protein [Pseudomonadales bacterium]|jgi:4-amino-4-deoxy-L-arabinose transferase-like glycosyltransferase|nr:glycosyltransferase family 39 protein [Pseudomonadales bacterium]
MNGAPTDPRAIMRDLLWLGVVGLLLFATGIGLRDPWPADEPRFAALARDMFHSGDWLFPRVGGDLYQDKPPLYFWLLAAAYGLTGNIRASFLLPSLLASLSVLALVYDLGRRIVDRRAGLLAALTLACTVQFLTTMRSAQIDATLCLLTTLSLYGLLRHLLWGPQWRWYTLGGFSAGLGVITKGVGFLPLLLMLIYPVLRKGNWNHLPRFTGGWRWSLAPLAMLLGICLWFIPMLISTAAHGGDYLAYRNGILFRQTVTRYGAAWHHNEPWHFFLVQVIPALWLPFSLLLFWLVPRWRAAWRARDARVWLPLLWVLTVLLFFSISPGKRGLYVNPALPALALAAAPFLAGLYAQRGVQRAALVLAAIPLLAALVFVIAHAAGASFAIKAVTQANLTGAWPLWLFLGLAAMTLTFALRHGKVAAWPAVLIALGLVFGYVIAPAMNPERSGGTFTQTALMKVAPTETVGLVAYKEQFLLYLDRPTINFGHRRWQEDGQDIFDAAAWLAAAPDRVLLAPKDETFEHCFAETRQEPVGESAGNEWFLIRGAPTQPCIAQGDAARAIAYDPAKLGR